MSNRRRRVLLLVMLLVGAALVRPLGSARAQEPAERAFTLKPLGTNVWAAIDARSLKNPAGANAGFVVGDDGVVVIDTFTTPTAAKQFLAEIRALTKLPVKFVVNTHYHADHSLGNAIFAEAGAAIVAERNVRDWIHPENLKFFGKDVKPEQKAMIEGIKAPTVGYEQSLNLYLGAREIQVRSFPGHTGGDSVVVIPDAKVAFGGDLFWRNTLPNMIDATTKSWIETLDTLAKSYSGYTFIPGHGEVGTTDDVVAFRRYLATVQKLVADVRAQGKSGDALADAVTPALTKEYGQWDFFQYLAKLNILQMDEELSGKKRVPQPRGR